MAQSYLHLKNPYIEGDDVLALQESLSRIEDPTTGLAYYNDTKDGVFGPATHNALIAFQAEMLIETTGMMSAETEDTLFDAVEAKNSERYLKLTDPYMRGTDVLALQKQLNLLINPTTLLPFYGGKLDGIFGPITNDAVIQFQKYAGIEVDGIVGPETRSALQKALSEQMKGPLNSLDFPYVSPTVISEINLALAGETELRIELVSEVLRWVWPCGSYIYGANLYKPDLTVQVPTVEYINERAEQHPAFFTGGRKEFLIAHYLECVQKGIPQACSDCSGLMVGIWRKAHIVSNTFDATANSIYRNYCTDIDKATLRPADCLFRKTGSGVPHMGMYLGSQWTIEAVGTAYGIQLSKLNQHEVRNQMSGMVEDKALFNAFGRPKFVP
jgi:peptidoglycan hydrolase-like protein with peptidoglycan-binding domain